VQSEIPKNTEKVDIKTSHEVKEEPKISNVPVFAIRPLPCLFIGYIGVAFTIFNYNYAVSVLCIMVSCGDSVLLPGVPFAVLSGFYPSVRFMCS
jgi:hypothetical protein